jgi:hypothetical protein
MGPSCRPTGPVGVSNRRQIARVPLANCDHVSIAAPSPSHIPTSFAEFQANSSRAPPGASVLGSQPDATLFQTGSSASTVVGFNGIATTFSGPVPLSGEPSRPLPYLAAGASS